ncbi:MAG: polysaccharide biosynthesis tyrosine autokinase [Bacilli bacterium]|nr:polysaccharide biosynthesis tyrosine autokinase [Bacilli bacterium]
MLDVITYYIKKLPIIILITIITSLIGSLYLNSINTINYKVESSIILKSSNQEVTSVELSLNQALLPTYKEIVKSKLVLNEVITNLNLKYNYDELKEMVNTTSSLDSNIIKITVTNENNNNIKAIVNEIVTVFSDKIDDIYHLNNVSILEEANSITIISSYYWYLLIFALSGTVISLILIGILYMFDNIIKTEKDIVKKTKIPLLGILKYTSNKTEINKNDDIKNIRTNVLFSMIDQTKKTILITSSNPKEGKSYVSANLAASFTELGYKTLLIDADIRKGRQHYIFNVFNKNGLSNTLLLDKFDILKQVQKTKIDNQYILTMGAIPPNPSEMLNSHKFDQLLKQANAAFDIVIIDAPPVNIVTDALILSKKVSQTIIVVKANMTSYNDLDKSISKVKDNLTGIIYNMKDEQ